MGQPFSRSLMIAQAIAFAMQVGKFDPMSPQFNYKSRGKGIGKPSKVHVRASGKYQPHQGKREISRRARQIQSGIIKASI